MRDEETELFAIAKSKRDPDWALDDRSVQLSIRLMLWEAFKKPTTLGQVEAAVDGLLSRLSVPRESFEILVAIEGLHPPKSPIQIEGVRIGLLQDLVGADVAKDILVRSGGKHPVWAKFAVTAPSRAYIGIAAARTMKDALDLLATLDHRQREFSGHPQEVLVGPIGFVQDPKGGLTDFGIPNDWRLGWGYSADPEVADDRPHLHYRTGPFPWIRLPAGAELSTALREAYRRFGHARRIGADPEAAIPLAISAIEALLSEREDKRYTATGRLILASIALDAPTMWPLELVSWFEQRNDILHDLVQATWTEREASGAFWSLYGVLDLISDFVLTQGVKTRKDLLDRLLTPKNVASAKSAIGKEIERLGRDADSALTPDYKRRLGAAIKTWGDIAKTLEPRTQ